jgi:short subunit dehydrogenase-like uncharacterized protein
VSERSIAVVGPTGFTGGLVVDALLRRGVPVRLVGRSLDRLTSVAARHRNANPELCPILEWERGRIAEVLAGCAAVVSCAGPFVEAGRPVVEAAIAAHVPYCDSTGEQPFIRWVYEEQNEPAQSAGVALVPAFGFDYVPGDLGAAIAVDGLGPLRRVDVVYAVETIGTSVGTRRTALAMLREPCLQRVDGRLVTERLGARRRQVDAGFATVVAGSFPGGESLMLPRHLDVDTVITHIGLPGRLSPASRWVSLLPRVLSLPGLGATLDQLVGRGPVGPGERARSGRIACHVEAQAADGRRRAVLVEGTDPYGFTATALAELATQMAGGNVDATGSCAPAEVVDPRNFLSARGFTVREVTPAG